MLSAQLLSVLQLRAQLPPTAAARQEAWALLEQIVDACIRKTEAGATLFCQTLSIASNQRMASETFDARTTRSSRHLSTARVDVTGQWRRGACQNH